MKSSFFLLCFHKIDTAKRAPVSLTKNSAEHVVYKIPLWVRGQINKDVASVCSIVRDCQLQYYLPIGNSFSGSSPYDNCLSSENFIYSFAV